MRIRHERVTVCLPPFLRQASRVYRLWSVSRACRAIGGLSPFASKVIPMVQKSVASSALLVTCLLSSQADAGVVATYDLGAGSKAATLQFDFENGNTHLATVRWNGSLTGFAALQIVAAAVPGGQLQYQTFSFGKFVTGIGLGTDYQYGEGDLWPIENWWHYWSAEGSSAFTESMIGAADRVLADGSRDAWVFGASTAPAAIPAPGVIAMAALAGLSARRRT